MRHSYSSVFVAALMAVAAVQASPMDNFAAKVAKMAKVAALDMKTAEVRGRSLAEDAHAHGTEESAFCKIVEKEAVCQAATAENKCTSSCAWDAEDKSCHTSESAAMQLMMTNGVLSMTGEVLGCALGYALDSSCPKPNCTMVDTCVISLAGTEASIPGDDHAMEHIMASTMHCLGRNSTTSCGADPLCEWSTAEGDCEISSAKMTTMMYEECKVTVKEIESKSASGALSTMFGAIAAIFSFVFLW